jgi:hypothetical protein
MSNLRIKYTITASVENDTPEFREFCKLVTDNVSILTGGCFTTFGSGYWSQDAVESNKKYSNVFEEIAFRLEVTSETDILSDIQQICKSAKDLSDAEVQWIDCNTQEVTAKHFEI